MFYSIHTMKIHQIFFHNSLRNFCYLISFDNGALYCIDPFDAGVVIQYLKTNLNRRSLTGIINTHDHCDHFSGNEELFEMYTCDVMAHPSAEIPKKNKNLLDQEVIYQNKEWSLKSVYTPGHTMTHLCVVLEKENSSYAVFTGDCFFNAGVGNCHNGGDPKTLYKTITHFFGDLDDDVLIYPGHEYLKRNLEFTQKYEPTNREAGKFLEKIKTINLDEVFFVNPMSLERKINTFLRLDNENLLVNLDMKTNNQEHVFLKLRELRNSW